MGTFSREVRATERPLETVVLEEGGVAKHLLTPSRWRQTSRGLYVSAGAAPTVAQRIVCAAALMPPDGVIGGWAAAYAHGVEMLDGLDAEKQERPIDVLLPSDLHRLDTAGIRYHRATLQANETTSASGVSITSMARTAIDLACWARSLTAAVVCLDLLLAAGLRHQALVAAEPTRRRGSVQARTALSLAQPGSRSPGETRLRLLYVREVGAPTPLLNPTLCDSAGRFVAVPDLFDVEAGVALEYDGASWASERSAGHRDVDQHREDNAREEAIERTGAIVVRADARDVGALRRQTAWRLGAARRRGLERDRARDRWIVRER